MLADVEGLPASGLDAGSRGAERQSVGNEQSFSFEDMPGMVRKTSGQDGMRFELGSQARCGYRVDT